MKVQWLLVFVMGCAGEPFAAWEEEGTREPVLPTVSMTSPSDLPASDLPASGSMSTSSAGQSSVSSIGGAPMDASEHEPDMMAAGAPSVNSDFRCRNDDDGICQCYSNGEFEDGWLNSDTCPPSNYCATRGPEACVCWANSADLDAFLTIVGTEKTDSCPIW